MDRDTFLFFHQDLSKHDETTTDKGARKIIICATIPACTSNDIATK